jgi:phosphoglycolate phosphatase-like HAD superfamily hydrolase
MAERHLRPATGSGNHQSLRESIRPLAEAYRTALLSLDGVICRGTVALPHAVGALAWASRLGLRPVVVTGAGSPAHGEVSALLRSRGFPAGDDDPVMPMPAVLNGRGPYLVVGDGLGADIKVANRRGLDSLLVLTGETTVGALLAARPALRPTYLAADLRGLLDTHPKVCAVGGSFTCGSWSARVKNQTVTLRAAPGRPADPVDGVRAMCHAAWRSADTGGGVCPERSVAAWLRAVSSVR